MVLWFLERDGWKKRGGEEKRATKVEKSSGRGRGEQWQQRNIEDRRRRDKNGGTRSIREEEMVAARL